MAVGSMEDDAGGSDGEKGTIGDDAAFAGWNLDVIDEGARIAVGIAKDIAQMTVFVAAHVQDAVEQIHAGVDSLNGGVDGIAFLIAPNGVVAHAEWKLLLEMEHVLNDSEVAQV